MTIIIQLFHDLFQLKHPACRQMTVLRQQPTPFCICILNQSFGFLSLSLTQTNRFESFYHAFLFCKFEEVRDRITFRRKDEYQRSDGNGISKTFFNLKRIKNNEIRSYFIEDPLLYFLYHFISPQTFYKDDFFEFCELVEFLRVLIFSLIVRFINYSKVIWKINEIRFNVFQSFQLAHSIYVTINIHPTTLLFYKTVYHLLSVQTKIFTSYQFLIILQLPSYSKGFLHLQSLGKSSKVYLV